MQDKPDYIVKFQRPKNTEIKYMNGAENEAAIEELIKKLPPLYNDNINIRFEQIGR